MRTQGVSGLVSLIIVLALGGCADTGGDIGGLVPAPKILKGSIGDDGIYTSMGKTFTVAVPYAQGSDDFRYMHVTEQYGTPETYVSFGPGAVQQGIYRVDIAMRATPGVMTPSLADVAPKLLENAEDRAEKAYGSRPSVVASDTTPIDGRTTFHWQLKQEVAAGKLVSDAPVILRHDIYAMDFGWAAATVWVQVEEGMPLQGRGMVPEQFADSLVLLPPENDATRRVAADGSYRFPKHPLSVTSPAMLCDIQGTTVYESDTSVDFVAPDWLWQLEGQYSVEAFPIPNTVTDKQSFTAASQSFFSGYIPNDRKRLGVNLKTTSVKEMEVAGMPAMRGIGVDPDKAMMVVTSMLGKSSIIVVSVLYPLHSGDDPDKAFPEGCYEKFLGSAKETD